MNDIKESPVQEKCSIPVLLYGYDRQRLEQLAQQWGTSLAGAIRHLIREAEVKLKTEESAAA